MSDIRKIQTGNNQYTLHARVSDKLAVNAQIGSDTKPVYIDSSGQVQACSREIPTVDTALNDKSTNAVQNKVIDAALKGKNPKAKADFIASADLTALPITAGVLDLNGYTLTLSGTTQLTGTLTIKNGTIGGEGTLKNDLLISINDCQLIKDSKIILSCAISLLDNIHVTDPTGNLFILNIGEDYNAIISPSTYCFVTNFSGITIEGTNASTEHIIFVQNGHNLLVKNVDAEVSDVYSVEFQGKFNADISNCQNVRLNSSQIDSSSTYTVCCSSVENGTGHSFIRYGFRDENGNLTDSLKPTNTIYEGGNSSITTSKAVYDYLQNYAKKSDIAAVYKYKGSVNKITDLPNPSNLTASNAGDVYNVGTASTSGSLVVKSGDNVAWVWDKQTNSGHWDNLSGTVDLSNYLQKGGKQTTTSTADGGSNVYTFKDGSTITVKNGSKGSTGAAGTSATWFSGGAVTGTSTTAKTFNVPGSKAGDMYLNTGTSNVYKATAANQWVYLCNIKGPQGTPGNNGTTPIIRVEAGTSIGVVGTPTVKANTVGATTTFTFNNLKGEKGNQGATGATVTWHSGTAVQNAGVHAVTNAKIGDMYLNTHTYDVFKATNAVQAAFNWVLVCNIKGAKGDAADIPKLGVGVAGTVPGTTAPPENNPNRNLYMWLNAGKGGTGVWQALPTIKYDGAGQGKVAKSYTQSIAVSTISGHGTATTKPTIQKITTGASDYRAVESDASGLLFVNVPAYEKNANTAQNTVLAAPTSGAGTATFRKLTSSDIPWNERFKVMTPAQYKASTKLTNVFYFILEE